MEDKRAWSAATANQTPPSLMRFIKSVGKTINNHQMIKDKEKVLLSVSGGKDSLALALALSVRLRWLPIKYNLEALMINWVEHPIGEKEQQLLHLYFNDLNIPLTIVDEKLNPTSFNGEFNCYLCSRNRRRILFDYASNNSITLIATGHHLNDLVETTLLNLVSRATFSTMLPIQEFFGGKLHIIRPLIETPEQKIENICRNYNLPVVKPVCPFDETNIRSRLKPIVKELVKIDKNGLFHIYDAHHFSYQIPRPNEIKD